MKSNGEPPLEGPFMVMARTLVVAEARSVEKHHQKKVHWPPINSKMPVTIITYGKDHPNSLFFLVLLLAKKNSTPILE